MQDIPAAIIISVAALIAVGFFCLGALYQDSRSERRWLKFIRENFDKRSDEALKKDYGK